MGRHIFEIRVLFAKFWSYQIHSRIARTTESWNFQFL